MALLYYVSLESKMPFIHYNFINVLVISATKMNIKSVEGTSVKWQVSDN